MITSFFIAPIYYFYPSIWGGVFILIIYSSVNHFCLSVTYRQYSKGLYISFVIHMYMITETNVQKISGTVYVRIPPHLANYLGLEKGDEINIQDDVGKHGKFLSFWRKDQEKK